MTMRTTFLVLFLTNAAMAQDQPAVSKLLSQACGAIGMNFQIKIDKKNHPTPSQEPGKALVYVIEDQKTKYVRDVTLRIGLDGGWTGAVRGNSYLFFSIEPGLHHLCADWELSSAPGDQLFALANFTAEKGKAYYFRARTLGSVASSVDRHPNESFVLDLDPMNEDQGQFLVASSGFSISQQSK